MNGSGSFGILATRWSNIVGCSPLGGDHCIDRAWGRSLVSSVVNPEAVDSCSTHDGDIVGVLD